MLATRRQFLSSAAFAGACVVLGHRRVLAAADGVAASVEFHIGMFTNQQRMARNLLALEVSDTLAAVARGHSREMLERGFFDHRTPDGTGPAQRLAKRGLRYDTWAENLFASTGGPADPMHLAAMIVGGWMSSESHRSNILQPDFRLLGVGVAAEGRRVTITELFAG